MNQYIKSIMLIVITGVLSTACSEMATPAMEEGELGTQVPMTQSIYDLSGSNEPVIEAIFENRSDSTLCIASGPWYGGAQLEKMDGKKWKSHGQWYFSTTGGPQVNSALPPGESVAFPSLEAKQVGLESGVYRFHFPVYRDEDCQDPVTEADRVSEPFTIIR